MPEETHAQLPGQTLGLKVSTRTQEVEGKSLLTTPSKPQSLEPRLPMQSCPYLGPQRALPPPRQTRLQTDPSPLIGKLSHQSFSQAAGRKQCQFPSWGNKPGKNAQAGPAGSLPRTLDGGLGPGFSPRFSPLCAFRAASVGTQ